MTGGWLVVTTVTWLTLLAKLFDRSGKSEFIVIIDVLAVDSLFGAAGVVGVDDDTEMPLLFDVLEVDESEFRTEIILVASVRSTWKWRHFSINKINRVENWLKMCELAMCTSGWLGVSSAGVGLVGGGSIISFRFGLLSLSSPAIASVAAFSSTNSFCGVAALAFGNDGGGGAGPFSFLTTYIQ